MLIHILVILIWRHNISAHISKIIYSITGTFLKITIKAVSLLIIIGIGFSHTSSTCSQILKLRVIIQIGFIRIWLLLSHSIVILRIKIIVASSLLLLVIFILLLQILHVVIIVRIGFVLHHLRRRHLYWVEIQVWTHHWVVIIMGCRVLKVLGRRYQHRGHQLLVLRLRRLR